MSVDAVAIITAAGSGSRLGEDIPKALVRAGGRTLLELALERVLAARGVGAVVVTCPAGYVGDFRDAVSHLRGVDKVSFVVGGASRQASVCAGLDQLESLLGDALAERTPVVVHDAARSLTPTELVEDLIGRVFDGCPAVIPGLPVVDTIKVVDSGSSFVSSTPDRATLRVVQTPQAFAWRVLREAHLGARGRGVDESSAATDDAALVEELGFPVLVIDGSPMAFKVTVPDDLARVEALLKDV